MTTLQPMVTLCTERARVNPLVGAFSKRISVIAKRCKVIFSLCQPLVTNTSQRMFKLSDMDVKSTELAAERDDLEFILKSSVPGLVSDSKRASDISENTSSAMHDGSATGHKLLVEPSVFNMGILLPPSLDFLTRLKEVVPSGSDIVMSTLTSFLDDFLVNVFHPQLDETLVDLCAQTFIELDAFQQDPQWVLHSKKPIFKVMRRLLIRADA